ncbi:hypothetical protein JTE90_022431 [Oedothorax gibbosus]|uniref:Uncharacterized protein n=1 Tax=Oedothorax gibbosus TaxID=931172 RepID=A0AAV6TRP2_9ARAC|nr:hypothetical protein JTE90_022431 [Oedothorax gibbosus]
MIKAPLKKNVLNCPTTPEDATLTARPSPKFSISAFTKDEFLPPGKSPKPSSFTRGETKMISTTGGQSHFATHFTSCTPVASPPVLLTG